MNQKSTFQLRSGSRKIAPMPESNARSGENLSDWLQEAARRPLAVVQESIFQASAEGGPHTRQATLRRRHPQSARDIVALAALTIGFLQYYYLDVMVQIGNLQRIVVFVPIPTA